MGDGELTPPGLGDGLAGVTTRAEFGALLTARRVRSGLSLRELASRVDSSASTLSGWCRAENLPFPAQHTVFRALLEALGVEDPDPWMEALARVRDGATARRDDAPAPYRGLASFSREDAAWFYGRSDLRERAQTRLRDLFDRKDRPRLLALVGASGSGKSSLLHAGLCASLAQHGVACLCLTPGPDPMDRLTSLLGSHHDTTPDEALQAAGSHTGGTVDLAVVVDQFEELFTAGADDAARDAFLSALEGLAGPGGRCAVIIGLRIDFYADLVATGRLVDSLQDAQVLVGPMSTAELRTAIVEPARRAGWSVDDELVTQLLNDFVPSGSLEGRHDAGALPLLSHALLETWTRARRGRLTVADYHAAGGIHGAVEQSAEQVVTALSPAAQALARQVFLRLIHLSDRAVVTRRVATYDELEGLSTSAGEEVGDTPVGPTVSAVLEPFVSARLVTAHESTVEITHESLLAAWPRLRGWIEQDRDGLRAQRRTAEATRIWVESGRDPSTLARGAWLEDMQRLADAESPTLRLSAEEQEFVAASAARVADAEQAARRRALRLRALVVVATVFGLLASSLAVVAGRSRADAVTARDEALSRQIALTAERLRASDPTLAAQLAVAGHRVAPTSEARSALLDSAVVPHAMRALGGPGATALAVSRDGLAAYSNATDGSVTLFDLGTRARVGTLTANAPDAEIYALALTPDGEVLAVGDTSATVGLWDVSDPTDPQRLTDPLEGLEGAVQRLAVSPDGRELAAAGTGDGVFRWDLRAPTDPVALPLVPVETTTWSVAYSPDGALVAFGDDVGGIHVWTRDGDPAPLAQMTLTDRQITTLAFAPDSATLAAGSRFGLLGVWDLTDPATPEPVEITDAQFDSWLNAAEFSPDGRHLVGGSSDMDLRVWDTESWERVQTLPHPAAITQVTFTADGQTLATAATDGALRVWDGSALQPAAQSSSVWNFGFAADGDLLTTFTGAETGLWDLTDTAAAQPLADPVLAPLLAFTGAGALSPDGTLLAHGTLTGEVLLVDVSDPDDPQLVGRPLGDPVGLVEGVVFSPDGTLLAAGGNDSAVRIWDITTPHRPRHTATVEDLGGTVLNLEWHPRLPLVAAPNASSTVHLIDVTDPDEPEVVALDGFESEAYGAAFHPDGEILAVAGSDTTVVLWDITDLHAPRPAGDPITGPVSRIFSLSFAPDGDRLAAGVGDGTTWVWDTRDLDRPARHAVLGPADGQAYAVAFSPRGDVLAGSGADPLLRLWPTDEQALVERICASAGDPITAEEWDTYVAGRAFDPPCPARP